MKKILKLIAVIMTMCLLLCACGNAKDEKATKKTEQKTEQQETTDKNQEAAGDNQEEQESTSDKADQQEATSKAPEQSGEETTKPGTDNKEYNDNVTDKLVIKLHYHRADNNYTDWSVWGWVQGEEGSDYSFAKENGEMVATIEVGKGVDSYGYIIKTPDWLQKDVAEDQFIDCSTYKTGTLHVFVESGVAGHTVQEGKDIVKGQAGNKTDNSTTGNQASKPAADKLVIKLHYHRADNNYADWSVWGWNEGCEGTDYAFVEESGEMVATMEVNAGVDSFGYIVRTPAWEKDVADDQYIDCSAYEAGTLHVYIESGVENYTAQEGDDIVKRG